MKNTIAPKILKAESILSNVLFQSDFYQIKNWDFDFQKNEATNKGYNDCFCFVFVRNGNYLFGQSVKRYDMHTGHVIIEKGHYEYSIRPSFGAITIFNFTDAFYQQFIEDMNLKNAYFFSNPNIISQVLLSSPDMEYLHFQISKQVTIGEKLEIDSLVLELINQIVACLTNNLNDEDINLDYQSYHLSTIENAKNYMLENFATDMSLFEISRHCLVSPFHFSQLFKRITGFSPYQYLYNIRLKHGEMLLKNTVLPITEVGLASGFSSAEHFTTAFRQKYGMNPTQFRKG